MLISVLSAIYSLIVVLFQKRFVYTPEYRRQTAELSNLRKKMMEARKRGDADAVRKLQRKYTMLAQQSMKNSMKIFAMMFVVLIFFWGFTFILSPLYGDLGNFIRIAFPIPPFIGDNVNAITWFIIASFLFVRLFSKMVGLY